MCGVRAGRCFERAARDDAGDTTPLASLAKLYKEDHEPDKAAATYRRLLEMLEGQVRPTTPLLSSAVGVESVWCGVRGAVAGGGAVRCGQRRPSLPRCASSSCATALPNCL